MSEYRKEVNMKRKLIALISLLTILAFIGFIVIDTIRSEPEPKVQEQGSQDKMIQDKWFVFNSLLVSEGHLKAVAACTNGDIIAAGESFVSCYNGSLEQKWTLKMPSGITAVAACGDTIFAASVELVYLISADGKLIDEWGPYEASSSITSISAFGQNIAFADAGNKRIFVLKKNGEVITMIGQSEKWFIIPSLYFDVALSEGNVLFAANTGNRRIETWTITGKFLEKFGEPGTAPGAFCGCCNPAHFAVIPQGFVTSEKGINRIKILDQYGVFVEYVSSRNSFTPSIPLDVASNDGITIYAANPSDGKIYVYKKR
jgi:hypothetical protein